jgi:serine protease Do
MRRQRPKKDSMEVFWMLRYALFALALLVSGCAAVPTMAQSPLLGPARGGAPTSFSPLVKRVVPAVVNIAVVEQGGDAQGVLPSEMRGLRDRLPGRRELVLGAGSGFIIDPSGIIVTNTHVVGHASRISVTLADGTELPAKLIGSDDLTDIAVIRVNSPAPLPYVVWGDSRVVEVGDWILAAGNPFGVGISVTAGIVSARGRDIGAGPFDDFLQIDAPINPGNSGGPTFNMEGQVIAVNTAIVSPTGGSVGIGFAVPSEMAARIVADLRDKGHIDRGWLGVSVQDAQDRRGVRGSGGVAIANIDRAGPAARAGMRAGDIVLAVDGARVDTAQGLIKAVAATPPGNAVRLTVRRGGQTIDVAITVGRRPTEQQG